VGVKFKSDSAGNITGIRFYKGAGNMGTHIGLLYAYPSGSLLAQATFTNETASGWQQVNFSSPVAITANTVYVAAYFSPTGFAYDAGAFTNSGVDNVLLHAIQTAVSGGNGVYAYGTGATYPVNSGGGANYWADVVFSPTGGLTVAPSLSIASSHSGNFTQGQTGATYTLTVTNNGGAATSGIVTATDTLPTGLTATAMSGVNWTCTQPAGPCTRSDALAASGSYETITVTVNVAANAPSSVTNNVTASGGGAASSVIANDVTTINASGSGSGAATSIFSPSATPGTPFLAGSLTVGVKFKSDSVGNITGIRFYKGAANTGTHVGLLYAYPSGTLLAQATFTNETASGWQQVSFSSPVSITANTVYVAAYFSPTGFAYDAAALTNAGIDNPPLHALQQGSVYSYSTGAQYPSNSGGGANYWADVVFSASGGLIASPSLSIASGHTGNFTQGQIGATYTLTVTNNGAAPTSGTVTVSDTLPTGLTATAMSGVNWTCTQPSGPCTRRDALTAGASYEAITVTLNVAANAASSVTNSVTASGGGAASSAPANDVTTINASGSGSGTASSIFSASAVPGTPFLAGSLTVGVKFKSDSAGNITGIRFYKGAANTGTHVGLLYAYPSGTLLAQATFTNETASGWQQVSFSSPVAIAANTVYVAAYFSSAGFAYDAGAFTNSGVDNAPLHALQTAVSGGSGVYAYGTAATYPSNSGGGANYWADVVFSASGGLIAAPSLSIASSHSGAFTQGQTGATYTLTVSNNGGAATSGTVTVTDAVPTGLTATAMSGVNWSCPQPSGPCTRSDALAASGSYETITVTVNVAANAASSVTNSVTASGGGAASAATANDVTTINASSGSGSGAATSIFSASATPGTPFVAGSLTVGVKFKADSAGNITGIRFYKGAGNTGTHVGLLYAYPSGTLLAQATFTNETASGWQQVNFASPVSITANTVYVAAYFSPTGFAYDAGAFTNSGVDNAPLHALQTAVSGGNGVYAYGTAATYPSNNGGGANYWADVVFSAGSGFIATPTLSITSRHAGNFTQGQTGATYTLTVTNNGTAATTGTVTVTESLPTGLTATAMSGANWTCTQPAGPCTRSDALAAGPSYETITVTVNVAANALSTLTNSVTASGGGAATSATANDVTSITASGGAGSGPATSIFGANSVPGTPFVAASLTVGVKFSSDTAGNITGIRFYKGTANTGTHIGLLYTSSGTLLAQATFTSETASGWQQVNFSSPVAIAPNTVYVAAYFSPSGFAYDAGTFTNAGIDNPPLHALQLGGATGGNGVYAYGTGAQYPANSGGGANYWVDVAFTPSSSIFSASARPGTMSITGSLTVGVKFKSDTAGYITGIRFYKAGLGFVGGYIGLLYDSSGTLLAQATLTNETFSGWQQVNFSAPVAISANTVYVAAYFSTSGFAYDAGVFTNAGIDNPPLHALQTGVAGGNGVYSYGTVATYPASSGSGVNYWVDVVFQ
jgi:uncharacterized repeat protein (TIGR01451 family)